MLVLVGSNTVTSLQENLFNVTVTSSQGFQTLDDGCDHLLDSFKWVGYLSLSDRMVLYQRMDTGMGGYGEECA